MAGHNKWSSIKHRKAAVDAKRGKVFTRIAKELTIAAREGGGDPENNASLRLLLSKARVANMPKDNIERAVKRGTGEIEGGELMELMYEGYAPHGVGLLIEVVTDNKNRAVADVRHALNKFNGAMATSGAVSWQFKRKGYVSLKGDSIDEDELFLVAADAGADDIEFTDEGAEIYSEIEDFEALKKVLEEGGYEFAEAKMIYDADNPMGLSVKEAQQVMTTIEKLEECDDVQNVYSNLDLTDEVIAALNAEE